MPSDNLSNIGKNQQNEKKWPSSCSGLKPYTCRVCNQVSVDKGTFQNQNCKKFQLCLEPAFSPGVFPKRPPLDTPTDSHWGEAVQVPVMSVLCVQEGHDYKVGHLGKGPATKSGDILEKIHTAFDPPSFLENYIANLLWQIWLHIYARRYDAR